MSTSDTGEKRAPRWRRFLAGLRLFCTPMPMYQCSDCGHTFGIGLTHDKTACEVAKLRREVAALRADVSGRSEP